jgi:hypothetical protein
MILHDGAFGFDCSQYNCFPGLYGFWFKIIAGKESDNVPPSNGRLYEVGVVCHQSRSIPSPGR